MEIKKQQSLAWMPWLFFSEPRLSNKSGMICFGNRADDQSNEKVMRVKRFF
ncbi:hypothetical protein [Acetobacterium woodii]|uniref:hypothetical protein n=1 Tax=Acetobacterium woodii TaxID=33952 RepID=UPI0002D44E42|nr:hypothetical protein [Acetobacterium woodii]